MFFARAFKLIVGSIYVINLLLLLAALACPYYDPGHYWILSLLGLFFKIFIAVHLFLMLVFLIGRVYSIFIFSCIILLFCIGPIIHATGLQVFGSLKLSNPDLKVMTYNIDDMQDFLDPYDTAQILKTVKEESPDIICFQEYYTNYEHKKSIVKRMDGMGYHFYYEYLTDPPKPGIGAGQALFSKIPFHNVQIIPFDSTINGAFSADFIIKGKPVRIYNIHFQSITLRDHETKIPSSLKDFQSPQKDYYRMLFTKIKWAFGKRGTQVRKVKREIQHTKVTVIVCGDFNDTPLSYTYKQMTEYLDDTFLESNFGLGSTYAGRIRLQRIDYILTSPYIRANTRVVHNPGSDHFPVVSTMSLE
jgi:endonuclease/exonuclease/phosphatase family metal-dependent hydrolase